MSKHVIKGSPVEEFCEDCCPQQDEIGCHIEQRRKEGLVEGRSQSSR